MLKETLRMLLIQTFQNLCEVIRTRNIRISWYISLHVHDAYIIIGKTQKLLQLDEPKGRWFKSDLSFPFY